jgi:hypothetical protein
MKHGATTSEGGPIPFSLSIQCNSDEIVTGGGFTIDLVNKGFGESTPDILESKNWTTVGLQVGLLASQAML